MADYFFGEIPNNPVGTTYASRQEAAKAGVHRVMVQGISGNGTAGAESISVNGGYEDDEDLGDEIIYTGAGGNDPGTGKQIADQTLSQAGNAGMVVSEENGYPVRVMRGFKGDKKYAPPSGYRYDGLYRVDKHWAETGKSGFPHLAFPTDPPDPAGGRALRPGRQLAGREPDARDARRELPSASCAARRSRTPSRSCTSTPARSATSNSRFP